MTAPWATQCSLLALMTLIMMLSQHTIHCQAASQSDMHQPSQEQWYRPGLAMVDVARYPAALDPDDDNTSLSRVSDNAQQSASSRLAAAPDHIQHRPSMHTAASESIAAAAARPRDHIISPVVKSSTSWQHSAHGLGPVLDIPPQDPAPAASSLQGIPAVQQPAQSWESDGDYSTAELKHTPPSPPPAPPGASLAPPSAMPAQGSVHSTNWQASSISGISSRNTDSTSAPPPPQGAHLDQTYVFRIGGPRPSTAPAYTASSLTSFLSLGIVQPGSDMTAAYASYDDVAGLDPPEGRGRSVADTMRIAEGRHRSADSRRRLDDNKFW